MKSLIIKKKEKIEPIPETSTTMDVFTFQDDVDYDDDDDDDSSLVPQEGETVRKSEVSVRKKDGYTTKDCTIQLELKYDAEYAGTYRVHATVVAAKGKGGGDGRMARMMKESNELGYLEGELIQRPHPMFHDVSEAISSELQELSCMFCDNRGIANRIQHSRLEHDACIDAGGFLHIDTVEVHPSQRGKDLSLKIIHETLHFLGDEWNIVVIKPVPLNYRFQKWRAKGASTRNILHEEEENEEIDQLKLHQHFARMGFVQAGRNPDLCHAFFLTSNHLVPPRNWVPRNKVQTAIDIYVAPKKHIPTELDWELQYMIRNTPTNETIFRSMVQLVAEETGDTEGSASESMADLARQVGAGREDAVKRMRDTFRRASGLKTTIQQIKELIDQGASIQGARAIHGAAEHAEKCGTGILNALIHFGGDVNFADEYGNTPLHIAAQSMTIQGITTLLEAGADPNIKNLSGDTPLQSFENALRDILDKAKATGVSPTAKDNQMYEKIRAILQIVMS